MLSDPQERAWYDAHRESILRGGSGVAGDAGDGPDPDDAGLDVWAYFSSACYSGFGDGDDSFYAVYNRVFREIAADEARHDAKAERPPFGDARSAWGEVRNFYGWWEGFSTARSCAGADKYDTRAAESRQIRRLMEKENSKARAERKRELSERVRALVAFVRKRDKRVQAHAEAAEAAKLAKATKLQVRVTRLPPHHPAPRPPHQPVPLPPHFPCPSLLSLPLPRRLTCPPPALGACRRTARRARRRTTRSESASTRSSRYLASTTRACRRRCKRSTS